MSEELKICAEKQEIRLGYIQPDNPLQNANIERFNSTVRYGRVIYLFESLNELQEFSTQWLWTYNHERPNMALVCAPKTALGTGRMICTYECP